VSHRSRHLAGCSAAAPQFGHGLLPLFSMDPKYVNMNHGSYGAVPKTVTAALQAAQASVEFCPDAFFRYEMFDQLDDGPCVSDIALGVALLSY
jgi:hypothetical protein